MNSSSNKHYDTLEQSYYNIFYHNPFEEREQTQYFHDNFEALYRIENEFTKELREKIV
jgi:hypothetical protein